MRLECADNRGKQDNEELVYKLIPPEKHHYEKSPRYKSKFTHQVKEEVKNSKCSHKTMGYAEVPLPRPSSYLNKRTRIVPPRPIIEGERCLAKEKKPEVPPHYLHRKEVAEGEGREHKKVGGDNNEEDVKFLDFNAARSSNYFRVKNIKNVLHSKPPQREFKIIDTCRGDRQSLLHSGLSPLYLHKKDYGRLPKYLIKIRKEEEKRMASQKQQTERFDPAVCIEGESRKRLLEGLKKDWFHLQTAFQRLPMMTDTIPKIKKKLTLEKELARLERDINIIEKHPVIILCDRTP